jgi:hypothetical protein
VAFVSWFAALFTGRVPDSFQEFLTGFLRLYANVYAYCYFLTPRWPGIAFSPKPGEQVTLAVDHVRLNRAAVFFRYVLVFPAGVVNELLTIGIIPFVAVMWLWGIVAGQGPRALHQSIALVLRYQIRLQAYSLLVTPTQPFGGLFGDGSDSQTAPPTARTTPPPVGPLGFGPLGSLTSDDESLPAVETAAPPVLPTWWVARKAARAIVIMSLVLAVPVCVGVLVAERPLFTKLQDTFARAIATSTYTTTVNAMNSFENSVSRCNASASSYAGCAAKAATTASPQLNTAASAIASTSFFPGYSEVLADIFKADLVQLEDEVTAVQFSTSASNSVNIVQNKIPQTLTGFKAQYQSLMHSLKN